MINIRKNLFETNSSSVHSFTMCDENDFNDWMAGKKFYCVNTDKFYTKEELLEYVKYKKLAYSFDCNWKARTFIYNGETYDLSKREEIAKKYLSTISDEEAEKFYEEYRKKNLDDMPVTRDEYYEYYDEWYETFETSFTSNNGTKVIAFGYYGYDA